MSAAHDRRGSSSRRPSICFRDASGNRQKLEEPAPLVLVTNASASRATLGPGRWFVGPGYLSACVPMSVEQYTAQHTLCRRAQARVPAHRTTRPTVKHRRVLQTVPLVRTVRTIRGAGLRACSIWSQTCYRCPGEGLLCRRPRRNGISNA